MRYPVLLALVCMIHSACLGQDFKAEVQRIQEAYTAIGNLHAEVEVSVYETLASETPYMVKRSSIKKQGDNYLCSMDGVTVLLNGKLALMVYDSDKQIILSKRDIKQERRMREAGAAPGLDVLLGKSDSITFSGVSGRLKHYMLYTASGPIRSAEICIDTETGFISRVVYFYDTNQFPMSAKVVVNYKTFELAPVFSEGEFSEQQFVKHSGKEAKAVGRYAGYNVLNYDPEKF